MTAAYRHVRRHFDAIMGGDIEPIVKANFLTSTSLPSWLTWTNPAGHRMMFDSSGYLTWAPNNLILRSQEFDNSYWDVTKCSISPNSATAPDGSSTADKIVEDNTSGQHWVGSSAATSITIFAGVKYSISVYAKMAERFYVRIYADAGSGSLTTGATFRLDNGTVYSQAAGATATITDIGGGWYRCSVVAVASSTSTLYPYIGMRSESDPANANYLGDGSSGLFVWGAQVERLTYETSARTYNATTSAAYYGPRFDYNPSTLAARGLLIEESRQNILTYSNTLNNAAWVDDASPITRSQNVTGPDGVSNSAWTLTDASAAAVGYIYQAANLTSGTTYTYSLFIKKTTGETVMPCISVSQSGASKRAGVNINTNTGTVTLWTSYTGETILASSSARVVEETTDYYRVALTFTAEGTASHVFVIVPANRTSLDAVGDGVASAQRSIVAYGAQLETGAFATSYIPTTTAAVTRNAETVGWSSSAITSYYNKDEGSVVAEVEHPRVVGATNVLFGGNTNGYQLRFDSTNMRSAIRGVADLITGTGPTVSSAPYRAAGTYKTGGNSISVNGGAAVTSAAAFTAGSLPVSIGIGYDANSNNNRVNGWIRYVSYYRSKLSDAQLQSVSVLSGPTTGFLLEDGTSFLLLEDGSYLLQE